jgi:hypothetical protein
VGRAWRWAFYTQYSPFYAGDGTTVADTEVEGEAWCRLDDESLVCRRALYTRSTRFLRESMYDKRGAERFARALLLWNLVEGQ